MRTRALLLNELKHHLPFTAAGSLSAMLALWLFGMFWLQEAKTVSLHEVSEGLFHLIHPIHLVLSAVATVSLFRHYDRRLGRAFAVGIFGAAVPCGLSDYFFPYLGGLVFRQPMHLHVCFLEDPILFWSFLLTGVLAGLAADRLVERSWLYSHGAHVFISSLASLLYLDTYGFADWMSNTAFIFPVFAILLLAVWLPCCLSDIVIPVATSCGPGACGHSHAEHSGEND